jgi:hypothetical protein
VILRHLLAVVGDVLCPAAALLVMVGVNVLHMLGEVLQLAGRLEAVPAGHEVLTLRVLDGGLGLCLLPAPTGLAALSQQLLDLLLRERQYWDVCFIGARLVPIVRLHR